MDGSFFEVVRNAFEGFVAGVDGRRNVWVHGRGLKVWFGDDTREHYEAQLIRTDGGQQLEIGFHAEHPKPALNDAVLQRLVSRENEWRGELGPEAEAGEFIGRKGWTRISELWPDPSADDASDIDDIDAAIDAAARLADYVIALEPVRRSTAPPRTEVPR